MYHLNAGIKYKKWSFDTNFYSEQDIKSQAIGQDLSIDKMPVKRYGHFGIILGYPEAYYLIDKKETQHQLKRKTLLLQIHEEWQ